MCLLDSLSTDQQRATLFMVDDILQTACGCHIEKSEGVPLPFETEIAQALLSKWGDATDEVVKKAVSALAAKGGDLTSEEIEAILRQVDRTMATEFALKVDAPVKGFLKQSYKVGKKEVFADRTAKATFDLVDDGAITWLQDHHVYWINTFYDQKVASGFTDFVAQAMRDGIGREAMGLQVKEFFSKYPDVQVKPDSYWRGLAANATSRSHNFGGVQGYVEVKVKRLQILAVMDERTSAICRSLNGKIIPISAAVQQRDAMMAAASPEDVKQISPWVSADSIEGLSTQEIIDRGVVLPPYHFHCRTIVVEV